MVNNPCWPRRISRNKLKTPTQMIGVISTPPMGGTSFRNSTKNGSVGQAIKFTGKRFKSTWGYQVRIIRKINKNIISPNKGPRIQAVRLTPVIGLSYYLWTQKKLGCKPNKFKLCKVLSIILAKCCHLLMKIAKGHGSNQIVGIEENLWMRCRAPTSWWLGICLGSFHGWTQVERLLKELIHH